MRGNERTITDAFFLFVCSTSTHNNTSRKSRLNCGRQRDENQASPHHKKGVSAPDANGGERDAAIIWRASR